MTPPKIGCGYEGCTAEVLHRPYARKRDMPSVTTVLGMLDDGKSRSFGWAASGIAATKAVHHPDEWDKLGTEGCTHDKTGFCPACKYIRSAFDREWSAKATIGTHVHHLCESLARGDEVDQDDVTAGYLDAYEKFTVDCMPQWLHLERTILYDRDKSHAYRGQIDGIADLYNPMTGDVGRWLLDIKTGRYSPKSQTLQLAAYRHATHLTTWDDGDETIDREMPKVEHTGVILISGDGTYQLAELPGNGDAFSTFLRLRDLHGWSKQMDRWEKEHPLKGADEDNQGEIAA